MKYQIFLINNKGQMCSFIEEGCCFESAKRKAQNKAKRIYGCDFKVYKGFEEIIPKGIKNAK